MIGLITLITLTAAQAADNPKFSVAMDTGMRPLGLPVFNGLLGGGLRVGAIVGPVTPFAGGSVTWISGSDARQQNDFTLSGSGTLLSGQAGLRVRVARLEAAETYLVGAALLVDHTLSLKQEIVSKQVTGVGFRSGLGGFAGGGADATLSNRVSIGVEAGVAYTGANARLFERFDREEFEEDVGGGLIWTYTHLRLTWWIGGDA